MRIELRDESIRASSIDGLGFEVIETGGTFGKMVDGDS